MGLLRRGTLGLGAGLMGRGLALGVGVWVTLVGFGVWGGASAALGQDVGGRGEREVISGTVVGLRPGSINVFTETGVVEVLVSGQPGRVQVGFIDEPGRVVEFDMKVYAKTNILQPGQWVTFQALSDPVTLLPIEPVEHMELVEPMDGMRGGIEPLVDGEVADDEGEELEEAPDEGAGIEGEGLGPALYEFLGKVTRVQEGAVSFSFGARQRRIETSPDTIVEFDTQRLDLLSLQDEVEVTGRRQDDGTYWATRIEAIHREPELVAAVGRLQERERAAEAEKAAKEEAAAKERMVGAAPPPPASRLDPGVGDEAGAAKPRRGGKYFGKRLKIN